MLHKNRERTKFSSTSSTRTHIRTRTRTQSSTGVLVAVPLLSCAGVHEAGVRKGERSDGDSLLVATSAREAPQEDGAEAAHRCEKGRGRHQGKKKKEKKRRRPGKTTAQNRNEPKTSFALAPTLYNPAAVCETAGCKGHAMTRSSAPPHLRRSLSSGQRLE